MASNSINIPNTPFVNPGDFRVTREWLQWLLNPTLQSLNLTSILGVTSGGTGIGGTPPVGTLLVGNGVGYSLQTKIPASSIPATSVTPGSYLAADITVGADGRLSAAANSSGSLGIDIDGVDSRVCSLESQVAVLMQQINDIQQGTTV